MKLTRAKRREIEELLMRLEGHPNLEPLHRPIRSGGVSVTTVKGVEPFPNDNYLLPYQCPGCGTVIDYGHTGHYGGGRGTANAAWFALLGACYACDRTLPRERELLALVIT